MPLRPAALLADIGGTNARFAIWDGELRRLAVLATADFDSFAAALVHFLAAAGDEPRPRRAAVSAAGPVRDGAVSLTNCGWEISQAAIGSALGAERVALVNDFHAVALSIPRLTADERRSLGGPAIPGEGPVGVLGPGTGLGVAGLVPHRGEPVAVVGEGGHVTLAAQSAREFAVIEHLAAAHGHVSAERVLSGPGLVASYRTLCALDGVPGVPAPTPAEVTRLVGSDPRAAEALGLFSGWLGAVAGDLALTLGAGGGIYLAGGIVPRLGPRFDEARFRAAFEAKGRFAGYLRAIPTFLITLEHPALRGLGALLE